MNQPFISLSLIGGLAAAEAAAQVPSKPNLVLIIADDCSYYDLGCYGAVNNRTPNIDALARQGIKFDNAYNSVSMSTPTRHCLYTGMYPMHHGGYANHSRVRDGVRSMPTYLKELGYRVGLTGKRHVNPQKAFPFEHVPGFPEGCTGLKTTHSMKGVREFVTRDPSQPFCLVVASINPHAPWTGGDPSVFDPDKLRLPPQFVDTKVTREFYARYLAEIGLLDKEVGDVVSLLDSEGLRDNTLVVFVSEQGTQFAGAKWTNWSAGVKAGMIASWPGVIEEGTSTSAIVQYEDILPTFIELAGGERPEAVDGRSLTAVMRGETDSHREYAYHVHNNVPEGPPYPIRSISDGHYRLIWNLTPEARYEEKHIVKNDWYVSWTEAGTEQARALLNRFHHRPEFELYDIRRDPFEMNNLAGKRRYARKQRELLEALTRWMESQCDPGAKADAPRKPNVKKKKEV